MAKKKQNLPQKNYLFEAVLAFLRNNRGKSFNYKQIAAAIELSDKSDKFKLLEVLDALEREKMIEETERGKYKLKGDKTIVSGVIDFTSSGDAYVTIEEGVPDVFIPAGKTKDALHGDIVKIAVFDTGRKRKEGTVTEVAQRNKREFVGVLQCTPKHCFLVPDSHKIHVDFYIPQGKNMNAENGQKVLVRMIDWKEGDKNPNAEVVQVFGFPGEHKTEIHAIMAEYGLPIHFPEEVEQEATSLPTEITEKEISRRRDFREILTFTIDPHDAKDFDDALSFRYLENGNYEVGVHIADVTHYLKEGTLLDDEAVRRATSVYLVDRVVPMLPEVLSNFACSLRPREEKYTFSSVFEMDEEGNVVDEWFGKTIIFSDRRFSYEEVQDIIETGKGDYVKEILILDKLAKKMRTRRAASGSIFFDKEEVKFHLDEAGVPLGVYFKRQLDAHKLIEDFMLLANRKVAELLGKPKINGRRNEKEEKKQAMVYRIHDAPSGDKMNALNTLVSKFGYKMNLKTRKSVTDSLNKLLQDVSGKKEAGMIELLAVRSMPKAIYTTKNIGHYGLGFDYYTHFTSPIRRYPDVMVHRLLDAHLRGKSFSNELDLENLCKHSSDMEKLAAEAERDSVKFKQVEYMERFVGDTFRGMISGVTEWGIYVELQENKCEGMVSVRDMRDDYYVYEEDSFRYVGRNTGRTYALGDIVWVEVRKADVLKRRLDFIFKLDAREKISERSFTKTEGRFSETNAEFAPKKKKGSSEGKSSGGSEFSKSKRKERGRGGDDKNKRSSDKKKRRW